MNAHEAYLEENDGFGYCDNNSDALRRTAMLRTNTACRFHATVGMAGPPAAYTLRAADAPLTHALNIFSFLFLSFS